MITKTANSFLNKEADWLDDRIYDVKQGAKDLLHSGRGFLGLNSVGDDAAHYADKGIEAGKHYGAKAIEGITDALKAGGNAIAGAVSPLGDKLKNFAADSARGYKDLYKYLTKDSDFLRSLKAADLPTNMLERARRKAQNFIAGAPIREKIYKQQGQDAQDTAKLLEPFANAYNNTADTVKSLGRKGKQWLESAFAGKRKWPETIDI